MRSYYVFKLPMASVALLTDSSARTYLVGRSTCESDVHVRLLSTSSAAFNDLGPPFRGAAITINPNPNPNPNPRNGGPPEWRAVAAFNRDEY